MDAADCILAVFQDLIAQEEARTQELRILAEKFEAMLNYDPANFDRGLPAIMEACMCCRTKAAEIKRSGLIDEAITQHEGERSFIVNKRLARQLYCHAYPRESARINQ